MHSIQNTKHKNPKSQPVIYYLKMIHKMFASFEGISNKLLVFFVCVCFLFFSFMKTMTHSSVLPRVGQWLLRRQPTSPVMWAKSLSVNQVHWAKLGENICLVIQHASLCLPRQNLGRLHIFFPFVRNACVKLHIFTKERGDFQAAGLWLSQSEQRHQVSWSCIPKSAIVY